MFRFSWILNPEKAKLLLNFERGQRNELSLPFYLKGPFPFVLDMFFSFFSFLKVSTTILSFLSCFQKHATGIFDCDEKSHSRILLLVF